MTVRFFFLFGLCYGFSPFATAALGPESCRDALTVLHNNFCITRDFNDYNQIFDYKLEPVLNGLAQESGHWVDMGAGEALAQIQFIQRKQSHELQTTAFALCAPTYRRNIIRREEDRHRGRFKYIEDWFTNETPDLLSPADVITDVYGVFNYTRAQFRDEIIDHYLSLLNPGGMIFLATEEEVQPRFWKSRRNSVEIEQIASEESGAFYIILRKKDE